MSALAVVAIGICFALVAAGATLAGTVIGRRADEGRWLRDSRLRAYLGLLEATHEVVHPATDLRIDDHRAIWQSADEVDVLGPANVAEAGRQLYEAAAEIMRYAITKGSDDLDADKIVAMADTYTRLRREFVVVSRAALS